MVLFALLGSGGRHENPARSGFLAKQIKNQLVNVSGFVRLVGGVELSCSFALAIENKNARGAVHAKFLGPKFLAFVEQKITRELGFYLIQEFVGLLFSVQGVHGDRKTNQPFISVLSLHLNQMR